MTEADVQKKLQEWLAIKGEADKLEKALKPLPELKAPAKPVNADSKLKTAGKVAALAGATLAGAVAGPIGAAVTGTAAHDALWPEQKKYREGMQQFKAKLARHKSIKAQRDMPKPNLPKSESVEKGSTAVLSASEKLDKSKYLKDMLQQVRAQKKLPATPAAGNTLDYSKMTPAPQGRVEGQRMHPRSLGSTTPKSNTLFDPQLSGKIKKSLLAQPAMVSAPAKINRGTMTEPKEIPSPVMVNAYKDKK